MALASKVTTGQVAKVKLKNPTTAPIGYKLKTNAPQKYSVRPVFGVVMPGETVKIFVRSEGWINPQDRFLLQSVALTDDEAQSFVAPTWKTLDTTRVSHFYIKCASTSALTLHDPEEGLVLDSLPSSSSLSTTNSGHSPLFPPIMTSFSIASSLSSSSSSSFAPLPAPSNIRRTSQPTYRPGSVLSSNHSSQDQYQYPAQQYHRWSISSHHHQQQQQQQQPQQQPQQLSSPPQTPQHRPTISIGAPVLVRRISNASTLSASISPLPSPGIYPFSYSNSSGNSNNNSPTMASSSPPSPLARHQTMPFKSLGSRTQPGPSETPRPRRYSSTQTHYHSIHRPTVVSGAERIETSAAPLTTATTIENEPEGFVHLLEIRLEGLGLQELLHKWDHRHYLSLLLQPLSMTRFLVMSFIACLLFGFVLPTSIRAMLQN